MTELEALNLSLRLWEYMKRYKVGKLEAYRQLGFPDDLFHCPACEYAIEVATTKKHQYPIGERCQYCPLWKFDEENPVLFACEEPDSPYIVWRQTTDASPMVSFIKQRIRDFHARNADQTKEPENDQN